MPAIDSTRLLDDLRSIPIIDVHTHLIGGKLGARGLHDILLYHMAVSDLYGAGCPSGARLTQYPGWPSREEARERILEALPYLPYVTNTSITWGRRIILRGLYGVADEVDSGNWERIDALIRERADDRAWHREVLKRAGIVRAGTELARREDGCDDDILQYALEWGFFTRCQWGEFDTALYELEKWWGKSPGSPSPIGTGQRPPVDRPIRTVDDVHEAMDWYVSQIPYDMVKATATHISTDIDFRDVSREDMAEALARREVAGPEERDIYASYVNELLLSGLEKQGEIVFQFSFAAEPLPFETASRVSQRTIAHVGEMAARHPKLHFQCYLSSRHANQSLCTLCRELPNFSLAGYWWHNFFPGTMRQVIEERLDMLPLNRQIGFFSDAYCVEWSYAKVELVLRQLAAVLAEKIGSGQYSHRTALEIARHVLYESPQTLNHMKPPV